MTWQKIERGLRKYEGKRGVSFQVLLRVGDGVICETFSSEKHLAISTAMFFCGF